MSDSRERFEAWYASDAYPMTRPIGWHSNGFRQNHGEYWVGEIQEEWLTWQAAWQARDADVAQAVRRCAEIAEQKAIEYRRQYKGTPGPMASGAAAITTRTRTA